jgi:uncharacterized membrane protein YeaQ/YmgE (transglycosylase-associated protein family)
MNFILWALAGAACGWLASRFVQHAEDPETGLNVVLGIAGAQLGGRVLSSLFGVAASQQGDYSFVSLLLAILGAVIVLVGSRFVRRGTSG